MQRPTSLVPRTEVSSAISKHWSTSGRRPLPRPLGVASRFHTSPVLDQEPTPAFPLVTAPCLGCRTHHIPTRKRMPGAAALPWSSSPGHPTAACQMGADAAGRLGNRTLPDPRREGPQTASLQGVSWHPSAQPDRLRLPIKVSARTSLRMRFWLRLQNHKDSNLQ